MTTIASEPISLVKSYAWCHAVAKQRARNFYFSFLTLPRDRFRDMCVLYAFMRVSDDLGDDDSIPLVERAAQLADWRQNVRLALDGGRFEHPALPALAEIVRRYGIPQRYLFDVIDGVESDLEPRQFDTFDQLSDYCYHVAGAVGLCCIHIWGFRDAKALDSAVDCGTAFQLTNILRDLGEDSAMNRIYLPREDLERFEYTVADLAAHRRDTRFAGLMQFQVERARDYYHRAEQLFDYLEPPGHAIYAAMMRIYGGLLSEIERRHYDVFSRRISLPRRRKLMAVARAVARHRWLGRLVPVSNKKPPMAS